MLREQFHVRDQVVSGVDRGRRRRRCAGVTDSQPRLVEQDDPVLAGRKQRRCWLEVLSTGPRGRRPPVYRVGSLRPPSRPVGRRRPRESIWWASISGTARASPQRRDRVGEISRCARGPGRRARSLVGVGGGGVAQIVADGGAALDELRRFSAGEPGHVLPDQHLSVGLSLPAPIPTVGQSLVARSAGQPGGTISMTTANALPPARRSRPAISWSAPSPWPCTRVATSPLTLCRS